jgi:serine/threonine-protein kinase
MELLDGEDLAARIARVGGLPMASVRRIVREMAEALDAAHAIGVIHRDLKPHNVFLCRRGDRDDHVKLLDFGVSKVLDAVAVTTERSSVLGTVQYMAPEVARGFIDAIDARTDVFGFGAIVWEMLTGRQAFTGPSLTAILHAVLSVDPPPVHALRRELSPQVSEVVARALAKERDARWPSCGELARALDAALVVAPPAPPAPPVPRRQIWPWIAGAGGVLAIAVVGALAVSKTSSPAAAPKRDVSCAEVTSHLVDVIHRERPDSRDDDVAEDVRRHCETDRWDAEARRCAMAATNLTDAEICVKK